MGDSNNTTVSMDLSVDVNFRTGDTNPVANSRNQTIQMSSMSVNLPDVKVEAIQLVPSLTPGTFTFSAFANLGTMGGSPMNIPMLIDPSKKVCFTRDGASETPCSEGDDYFVMQSPTFSAGYYLARNNITLTYSSISCTVDIPEVDVDMGYHTTDLSGAPHVPFNVDFTCSGGTVADMQPKVTFMATEGSGGNENIILNGADTDAAAGVGVKLFDKYGNDMPVNESFDYPDTLPLSSTSGHGILEFQAQMVNLSGETASAGKYDAVATLEVEYP